MTDKKQQLQAVAPDEMAGSRVDQVMSKLFTDFSRSRITDWIRRGEATVNGESCKPKDKLHGGEELTLNVIIETQTEFQPQDIPLDIIRDDEHSLVINKPAGLVIHPAAGNHDGTLLNGLLYHFPDDLPSLIIRIEPDLKFHETLKEQLDAILSERDRLITILENT